MRPITWWLLFVHLMLSGLGAVIDGAPALPAPCWRAPRRIAEPTRRFVGETARPQWKVPPWGCHRAFTPVDHLDAAQLFPLSLPEGEAGWWSLSGKRYRGEKPLRTPEPRPGSSSKRSDQSSLGSTGSIPSVGGPPARPSSEPGAEGSPTHELGVLQQAIA